MKKLGKIEKIDQETGEVSNVTSSGLSYIPRSGWTLQRSHQETNLMPSMTVQKQAFNIRDLLVKSSRGLNMVNEYEPIDLGEQSYDDEDFGRISRMDIHEQEQILTQARTRAKATELKIQEQIRLAKAKQLAEDEAKAKKAEPVKAKAKQAPAS